MINPFPSPHEQDKRRNAELQPQIQRLREIVNEAFAQPTPHNEYRVRLHDGIGQQAYEAVAAELVEDGWRTRFDETPSLSAWVISPAY